MVSGSSPMFSTTLKKGFVKVTVTLARSPAPATSSVHVTPLHKYRTSIAVSGQLLSQEEEELAGTHGWQSFVLPGHKLRRFPSAPIRPASCSSHGSVLWVWLRKTLVVMFVTEN